MCLAESLHPVTATTMLTAAAACLFVPALAKADHHGHHDGPGAGITDVWDEFVDSCGALLTDPEGFVTGHPVSAPDGRPLIKSSDDNQVLVLDHVTPSGVWRQMELIGVPGELHVLCQASSDPDPEGLLDQSSYEATSDRSEAELRAIVVSDGGAVVVGGRMPVSDPVPSIPGMMVPPIEIYTYILGIQTEFAGARRFVYANINGSAMRLVGHYAIAAEPGLGPSDDRGSELAPAQTQAPDGSTAPPETTMQIIAEICLRNYRTPENAVSELQALGLSFTPGMDAGTWEFSGNAVHGVVVPDQELYCMIQSGDVSLDQARAAGEEVAHRLFPNLVQAGAPDGRNGPCDGLSVFAPRQLIRIHYAQAGNSGECIDDGTSAIMIN
jgi:hypothetical protein